MSYILEQEWVRRAQANFESHCERQLQTYYPEETLIDVSQDPLVESWTDPPFVLRKLWELLRFSQVLGSQEYDYLVDQTLPRIVEAAQEQLLYLSRYNGSWLDSTWVVLGLSSRRRAWYRSFCSLSDLARLERWLNSLAQTILCCLSLPWWGDRYLGYEEGQWGPIVTNDKSESWSSSKGTQLRGIGRSER